jgi:ferredoxin
MIMKAYVDRDTCIGCGICPSVCPEVFEMDDENIAIVKVEEVSADLEASAKEAEESCPVDAITVE